MGRDGGFVEGGGKALDPRVGAQAGELVTNDKYVVFKRDTWDWKNGSYTELQPADEVHDAVVIRLQDVFAESALWTYANEIRAALEILALMEVQSDHPKIVRLHEIADYFQAMSMAAGRAAKKVPD